MAVPLLDLTRQYATLAPELEAAALAVLRSCRYINGPDVQALESELAAWCGARHGIALSSGTDALLAALMALGVGPGDEVITTAYSFFASAGCIKRLGARPVFVDIEPRSKNMVPALVQKAITRRTKAVIPVHLFGRTADIAAIRSFCDPLRIPVIEDAAQAIGSKLRGRKVGTLATMACFSFFPSKNLGGCGDGGFLTTDDADLAAKVLRIRNHGQSDAYLHPVVGANFRLDTLQCAALRVKLRHLDRWNAARRANAARYAALFRRHGIDGLVKAPEDDPDLHTYHQYVIDVPRRDQVLASLKEKGVGCAVYYPHPLTSQPCFAADVAGQGSFPVADEASRTALALPIFPELTEAEAEEVAAALAAAVSAR
jgi:dTDP-4-amino-4,6-dideoxygalactose transaminase